MRLIERDVRHGARALRQVIAADFEIGLKLQELIERDLGRRDCDRPGNPHSMQAFDGRFDHYSMGTGANPYKLRWNNETETIHGVRVLRRTLKVGLIYFIDNKIRPMASRMRARMRGSQSKNEQDSPQEESAK